MFSVVLGGCATVEQNAQASGQVKLEDMLAEATAVSNAGKNDKAMAILMEATGSFPAEKTPWLRIAQMHFDSGNYGEAITSAQEVLQRDPDDQLASSIIAVSGLRLSTKILVDMSRQNSVSGSLKTEAKDLAKLLRKTLGEPVLVPARSRTTVTPSRVVPIIRSASDNAARSASGGGNSNPFGALK